MYVAKYRQTPRSFRWCPIMVDRSQLVLGKCSERGAGIISLFPTQPNPQQQSPFTGRKKTSSVVVRLLKQKKKKKRRCGEQEEVSASVTTGLTCEYFGIIYHVSGGLHVCPYMEKTIATRNGAYAVKGNVLKKCSWMKEFISLQTVFSFFGLLCLLW